MKTKQETQIPLTKKEASWTFLILKIILLLLVLGGCVYLVFTLPIKSAQISKLRSENLISDIGSQDMVLLKQSIDSSASERERMLAAFPDESSLLDFISLIDKLKSESVAVAQFSVDSDVPTKIGTTPSFLPMTLVLKGEPKAVQEALISIAKSQYFIRPIIITYNNTLDGKLIEIKSSFQLFVREPYASKKNK